MIGDLITNDNLYSMEDLYKQLGRSRQQYHQQIHRDQKANKESSLIIQAVIKWRQRHSAMGSRVTYYSLKNSGFSLTIGINKFEKLMAANDLTVGKVKKHGPKTSDGKGKNNYPNLTSGLILNNINQLIVGDITYYWVDNSWHYIFTLKDVYSQRIISLKASKEMKATDALDCLGDYEKLRGRPVAIKTIHHTDNGSQYESKIYKTRMKYLKLRISRSEKCQENGSAEQLNHIIKNMYLNNWNIKTFKELKQACKEIKYLNNHQRAIKQLDYLTPINFENSIKTIPINKRKKKRMHDFRK